MVACCEDSAYPWNPLCAHQLAHFSSVSYKPPHYHSVMFLRKVVVSSFIFSVDFNRLRVTFYRPSSYALQPHTAGQKFGSWCIAFFPKTFPDVFSGPNVKLLTFLFTCNITVVFNKRMLALSIFFFCLFTSVSFCSRVAPYSQTQKYKFYLLCISVFNSLLCYLHRESCK